MLHPLRTLPLALLLVAPPAAGASLDSERVDTALGAWASGVTVPIADGFVWARPGAGRDRGVVVERRALDLAPRWSTAVALPKPHVDMKLGLAWTSRGPAPMLMPDVELVPGAHLQHVSVVGNDVRLLSSVVSGAVMHRLDLGSGGTREEVLVDRAARGASVGFVVAPESGHFAVVTIDDAMENLVVDFRDPEGQKLGDAQVAVPRRRPATGLGLRQLALDDDGNLHVVCGTDAQHVTIRRVTPAGSEAVVEVGTTDRYLEDAWLVTARDAPPRLAAAPRGKKGKKATPIAVAPRVVRVALVAETSSVRKRPSAFLSAELDFASAKVASGSAQGFDALFPGAEGPATWNLTEVTMLAGGDLVVEARRGSVNALSDWRPSAQAQDWSAARPSDVTRRLGDMGVARLARSGTTAWSTLVEGELVGRLDWLGLAGPVQSWVSGGELRRLRLDGGLFSQSVVFDRIDLNSGAHADPLSVLAGTEGTLVARLATPLPDGSVAVPLAPGGFDFTHLDIRRLDVHDR